MYVIFNTIMNMPYTMYEIYNAGIYNALHSSTQLTILIKLTVREAQQTYTSKH